MKQADGIVHKVVVKVDYSEMHEPSPEAGVGKPFNLIVAEVKLKIETKMRTQMTMVSASNDTENNDADDNNNNDDDDF